MDGVKVFLRKRPIFTEGTEFDILNQEGQCLKLEDHRPCIKKKQKHKKFRLKKGLHFWPDSDNNQIIYEKSLRADIQSFISGKCRGLLVLTYGQTGSGKTHTIMGTKHEKGLLQLYLQHLFNEKDTSSDIYLSSFEIYNEKVSDLLHSKKILKPWSSILTHSQRKKITSLDKLSDYIQIINSNKIMGKTKINDNSSRSHTIYKVDLNSRSLIFIDLAGTERGKLSVAVNRKQMQEGNAINMSLFSLKECIRSLRERKTYIPFRRSRLTIVLRDIFQQHFDIRFIATLNPSSRQFHDTLDTIRYAVSLSVSDLHQIELNETVKVEEKKVLKPLVPKIPIQKRLPGIQMRVSRPNPRNHCPPLSARPSMRDVCRARHERPLSSARKSNYVPQTPLDLSKEGRTHSLVPPINTRPRTRPKSPPVRDSDGDFTGFLKHYYDYIMNLHSLIRQDHRVFERRKNGLITEKNAAKAVLSHIKKKRLLMKDLSTSIQPYLNGNRSDGEIYSIAQEAVQAIEKYDEGCI
jgi:hypothetical protein